MRDFGTCASVRASGTSSVTRVSHAAPAQGRLRSKSGFASLASLLVVAHVLTTAEPAEAQSQTTDRVLAEALFREGRDLMDQDKTSEACAKFAESYRLDRALGTLLNLAVCHEKEGKTATAWAEFTEAAAEAANEKDREAFAKKHASALAPDLPRIRLAVAPPASALGSLEIRLDGNRIGRGVWASALPLDPGDHDVTASADGKKPYRMTFTIPKGPGITNVAVPALEDAPKPVAASPEAGHDRSNGGTAQRALGYALGGLGIAGLAVGTGFGVRALSLKDDRDARCSADGCDASGVAKDESARDAATISTIGFIGGAALLTGGIVLVLTAPKSSVRVGTTGRELFVGGMF